MPKEVRRARAQALKELGGIFLDAAAMRQEVAPAADDSQVGWLGKIRACKRGLRISFSAVWSLDLLPSLLQCSVRGIHGSATAPT